MAKVIEGYSQLRKDYDKRMNKFKIALLIALVAFFLTGWKSFFFFIMLGCIVYALFQYSCAKEFKTGVDGEKVMHVVTRKLPPSYTVISNVELFHEGKSTLYDCIIVGPAGIYVIEVKNMNGRVVGYANQYELTQHKVGRNGGQYSKEVKNPIKAVAFQTHLLSSLLKHHNVGAWVNGIVFFSNRSVNVNIKGAHIPIFVYGASGAKNLKKYIIDQQSNNQSLSEQAQSKVIGLLTGKAS